MVNAWRANCCNSREGSEGEEEKDRNGSAVKAPLGSLSSPTQQLEWALPLHLP